MNPFAEKLPNKFVAEFDCFRKFTLKERLQLLLGFNILAKVRVVVNRRDATVKQRTEVTLTKHIDPIEITKEDNHL